MKRRAENMGFNLPSQVRQLRFALAPHRAQWNKWKKSSDCFLTEDELYLVELYLEKRDYIRCAGILKTDELIVYVRIELIIKKLNLYRTFLGRK